MLVLEIQRAGAVEHHLLLAELHVVVEIVVIGKHQVRLLAHYPTVIRPPLGQAVGRLNLDVAWGLGEQVVEGAIAGLKIRAGGSPINIGRVASACLAEFSPIIRRVTVDKSRNFGAFAGTILVIVEQFDPELLDGQGVVHPALRRVALRIHRCETGLNVLPVSHDEALVDYPPTVNAKRDGLSGPSRTYS